MVISGYQSITPDDIESFTTGNRSVKATVVNPLHVLGHQPPNTYTNAPMTIDQLDMFNATIAPGISNFNTITKIQDKNT